ncbi:MULTISPECIES: SpoIIE family protein phosphatase [unclassified Methylocaldum]|jgi:sigma-B regulation protein RsbU (phosphoserine phosphatase)|uniref:SpoIIE family protein phosphatase n=1 Tax=unclassified Methylocaldum TaxID=2622260 RepID=UPI001B689886|nr:MULTISPECIES: SpoIIE family protein phosphatase [unclassified Methylocaldum]MBP1150521.1 PAS domain S-box-containing protein [Methylocaldum sp. RMAD-M]
MEPGKFPLSQQTPSKMQGFFRESLGWALDQYGTVLGLLAMTAVVSYAVLIADLRSQEGSAAALNLAGHERMLVERGVVLAMKMTATESHVERQAIRQQMVDTISLFENMHGYLRNGDRLVRQGPRLLAEPGELAPELRLIYFEDPIKLDQQINAYIEAIRKLLSRPVDAVNSDDPYFQYLTSDAPEKILSGLDKVVAYYQQNADFRLQNTQDLQGVMLALFLFALAFGGMGLLNPLVKRLKDSMANLQAQRDFNENIINTAQALIIGLDTRGKIILFNRYAQEISGWTEDEVRGSEFFAMLFTPEQQGQMRVLFDDVVQGGLSGETGTEVPMRIRSEELVDIIWHATVVRDQDSKQPVLFLITGDDITERKRAEDRLQATLVELEKLSSRLQEEINLAAALQHSILPSPDIVLPGVHGVASLTTSSEVGGDYYDYYKVGGYYAVMVIGDVSGHGVAAGTMVSAAKAGLYPLANEGVTRPAEILRSLNETMLATAHQSLLMTMGCLSLDSRTGHLRFANAGHVLPYLKRRGDKHWTMIEGGGLPLGKSRDSDYLSVELDLQLDIGDRIFLYTDGVVEQESARGEPFGYERLEAILNENAEAEPRVLEEKILAALKAYGGRDHFDDDVTVAVLEHTDRVEVQAARDEDSAQLIRITEGFYRGQSDHFTSPTSRQLVVFLSEGEFHDLLPRLSVDGIRRVLPRDDAFYHRLGWEHLLSQHQASPDDDIYCLVPGRVAERQFQLTHSDDKLFFMEEGRAWLEELGVMAPDQLESILLVLDEMVENSLYGAPRDGQSRPFYLKGTTRNLSENEHVRIHLAVGSDTIGLSVTDNWGTLTPAIFLDHLTHTLAKGVEAGIGGAGLYLMWRMSDYLQVRVTPHRRTQITTLWDLSRPLQVGLKTGFQFLYHSEHDEVVSHDSGRFTFH